MSKKARQRVTRTHRRKAKQAVTHGPKAKPRHASPKGGKHRRGRKGMALGPTR